MTARRLLLMFIGSLAGLPSGAAAQTSAPTRGLSILQMQGCIACHSLDGSISAGPTFLGRYGRPTRVVVDGVETERLFDADYVRRSLEDPAEALAVGYAPGVMPRFVLTAEQLAAVNRALAALGPGPADETGEPRPLPRLLTVCAWVAAAGATHLALWQRRVRAWLTHTFGRPGHLALYGVAMLTSVVPAGFLLWRAWMAY